MPESDPASLAVCLSRTHPLPALLCPPSQVREAAVHSVASLLSRLQFFSRQYYQVVEEMVMALSGDDSEVVSQAMGQQLLPVLQVQCSRGGGVTARQEWWESVAV